VPSTVTPSVSPCGRSSTLATVTQAVMAGYLLLALRGWSQFASSDARPLNASWSRLRAAPRLPRDDVEGAGREANHEDVVARRLDTRLVEEVDCDH
jgi:hypothetical protein